MSRAVIEHRRSTRREGLKHLLQLGAFVITFGIVYRWFFAGWLGNWPPTALLNVFGVLTLLLAANSVWEIIRNQEFSCRIDEEYLECNSPKYSGDSFKLKISDIAKICKETGSESPSWYIYNTAGHRYWLTSNYGNPVRRFVKAIHEADKSVIEEEVSIASR
jgi:hypothetical protein